MDTTAAVNVTERAAETARTDVPGAGNFGARNTSPSDWLSIDGVCAHAGISASLAYKEIRAGRLRAARLGGRRNVRVLRRWVDEWLYAGASR
jgi:excisionase family DNA binding protein